MILFLLSGVNQPLNGKIQHHDHDKDRDNTGHVIPVTCGAATMSNSS